MREKTLIGLMAGGVGCGIILVQLAVWGAGIAAAVWIVKTVWSAV